MQVYFVLYKQCLHTGILEFDTLFSFLFTLGSWSNNKSNSSTHVLAHAQCTGTCSHTKIMYKCLLCGTVQIDLPKVQLITGCISASRCSV